MDWAIEEKGYSQRRACGLVGIEPKTYRYASRRPDDGETRTRLRELANERRRFGSRRRARRRLAAGALSSFCRAPLAVGERDVAACSLRGG